MESFLQSSLKDEVMKIMPVQKQTRAGQRTRFKVPLSSMQTSFHVSGFLKRICPEIERNATDLGRGAGSSV